MTGIPAVSRLTRDGSYVTKTLSPSHPAGRRFLNAMLADDGIGTYVAALADVGIRLPPELTVLDDGQWPAVRHRWVHGAQLPELAATRPQRFTAAIATIIDGIGAAWQRDACIDTNLANFCLSGDFPVLVDVLPPLIPSQRPPPCDLFDQLFHALCFDPTVTIHALIGYAARQLLHCGHRRAPDMVDLAHTRCPELSRPISAGFPASWFHTRAVLALAALSGTVPPHRAAAFFADTSVLAFRHLTEPARRRRIATVHIRIEEDVLP